MSGKVLVLNNDYTPLTVCSVYRAFLLVFTSKAEMLNSEKGSFLRSISKSFPKPSVIRINRYINVPYKGVVLTRHNIFKRDNNECQYCGTTKDLTLDHLIPKSKGGKSSWKNLVSACKRCNAQKGNHTPEQSGLVLRKIPIKPSYIMFLRNKSGNIKEDWLQYLKKPDAVA